MKTTIGKSKPLNLFLIRHGETEWSLSGQHTGRTDIPLTARGEDEARGLARRLQGIRFAHVLTSPRQRARRTCELAGLGPAAEINPDLAEWDYGDYDSQRSVDIRIDRPDWNLFRDGCPHGETPADVSERIDRLIAGLRALEGNVALFSHGQIGCVLAVRWIGLPLIEAQHFSLSTASVSHLGFDAHHPETPIIAKWNAATHEFLGPGSYPHARDAEGLKQRALSRWENEGGEVQHERPNEEHSTPTSSLDMSRPEGA
jgi:probable phosphoglycerate mutase